MTMRIRVFLFVASVMFLASALPASAAIYPILDDAKGTRIVIITPGPNAPACAVGAKGTVIEVRQEGWALLNDQGDFYLNKQNTPIFTQHLPQGFTAWDWETTDFPAKPSGILFGNTVIRLDSGQMISAADFCEFGYEDVAAEQVFADRVKAKLDIITAKLRAAKASQQTP
ncbi:MAG: hypothetical protein Q8Q39_00385 [bacterium]|nr:hypothetical protein [bacterium]